jgi:hypothetical protein
VRSGCTAGGSGNDPRLTHRPDRVTVGRPPAHRPSPELMERLISTIAEIELPGHQPPDPANHPSMVSLMRYRHRFVTVRRMRSKGLSFADAVRLLDGDSEMVDRLGGAAGVAAGAVTVASLGTVDFFALRDQVVRWGHAAVRKWRDSVRGQSRFDRTDRIVAAYTVIVLVSFYEAVDEALGPDAQLTAAEQVALAAGGHLTAEYAEMVAVLVRDPAPVPSPGKPFEVAEAELSGYYDRCATKLVHFLSGLAAFDAADPDMTVANVVGGARRRFVEHYRRLGAEIPEFLLWSQMVDGQATRASIREAIDKLRTDPDAVDAVRDGLTRRYAAQLDKPILSSADAPAELILPTLRSGYQEPQGLVATAGPGDLPATGAWWEAHGERVADIPDFLLAALTTRQATDGPLVVLGQPGSGKSVLTRVLAARLSTADFLPVRVELRNVRADSPAQKQIEEALYLLVGEAVTWPDLVRRAGTALPVVLLDGFDELLQATGQNWADYLEQLQDFQQREAELGRPLAVVVTSRTVVADRARFPAGTTVVRLDPLGEEQVTAWLQVWNSLNGPGLVARGLKPLPADVVLDQWELAAQPLLLLLLALYDGRDNQLQRRGGGLGRVDLYESLFQDFFERQVDKFGTALSPEQWDAEVAAEWRRLSAVAIAMHNRGRDLILEPELESDLRHLLSEDDRTAGPAGTGRPLTAAQLLVGRFFFVHESRASRGTGGSERSFEFLHATFGDFLAAHQIVGALTDLAEDRDYLRRRPGSTLDAGLFYALTSFTTVTRRQPLWEFCQGLVARLDADTRRSCRGLMLELLPESGFPHLTWTLAGYEPERRTMAARQAAFSANLMCLAVLLTDGPADAAELTGEPVPIMWARHALLWLSHLDHEDSQRLWRSLRVDWDGDLRVRVEDGTDVSMLASVPWPPWARPAPQPDGDAAWDVVVPSESTTGEMLRRLAFAQASIDNRELVYAMAPFWSRFGDITHAQVDSDARALWEMFLSADDPAAYIRVLTIAAPDVKRIALDHLDQALPALGPIQMQRVAAQAAPHLNSEQTARLVGLLAGLVPRCGVDAKSVLAASSRYLNAAAQASLRDLLAVS